MFREPVLKLLQAYQPFQNADKQARDETLAFVRTTENCFERTSLCGHLTGSAWIVNPSHNMALLTHHRKLNRWLQLGGHADGDPDIFRVAHREALEESGLTRITPFSTEIFDIDIHEIPARASEPRHKHYDLRFLFEADPSLPLVISDESHDLQWIAYDQLEQYETDQSVLRLMRKTLRLK